LNVDNGYHFVTRHRWRLGELVDGNIEISVPSDSPRKQSQVV
jgi:hypothetical protein